MPRNTKRKHRLTKREINQLRKMTKLEGLSQETKEIGFEIHHETDIPSVIYTSQKVRTHQGVFQNFYPSVVCIYMNHKTVGFITEEDRNLYEQWYSEYSKKFGEALDFDYPPPSDGLYPFIEPLHVSKASNNRKLSSIASSRETEFEKWVWCLENCLGEVRVMGGYLFFAEHEDAALYRITFQ